MSSYVNFLGSYVFFTSLSWYTSYVHDVEPRV